ncbi:hypothetical protein BH18ACT2_BH18ACT2_14670 [soil metagenome]
MPRRGQHDQSPGDRRQPYSDEGGPAGHHATTHDVAREELTRPKGPGDDEDEFADDLAPVNTPGSPGRQGGHADESSSAADEKDLRQLGLLGADDLAQLQVLTVGARLEQGSVYVDLDDLDGGPFKAMGGQEAGADNRYVAKRDTDHELWNRLVGQGTEPEIERPTDQ